MAIGSYRVFAKEGWTIPVKTGIQYNTSFDLDFCISRNAYLHNNDNHYNNDNVYFATIPKLSSASCKSVPGM